MPAELHSGTHHAMDTFRRLLLAERRVERCNVEHTLAMAFVPEEDMPEFYRVTQEMAAVSEAASPTTQADRFIRGVLDASVELDERG